MHLAEVGRYPHKKLFTSGIEQFCNDMIFFVFEATTTSMTTTKKEKVQIVAKFFEYQIRMFFSDDIKI